RISRFIITFLLLSCGTIQASLQSYSTGERHWIAARTALPDGNAYTELFTRPIAVGAEWKRLTRIGPRVVDLAHRGSDVVAVTDAGNWLIAWAGDVVYPPRLPDSASMLEIATSPEGGFWALGEIRSSSASTQPVASA
ncbi:MAG TPA: hypothetical protein PKB10_14380, partial [Tepidisphaeraceae bacterium]|nr:hypothetical protein [Tepidisphaeraceae bacterium]